jgi:hypothetical protein
MKKLVTFYLAVVCVVAATLLVQAPMARAEMITFDGPGYVAGSTPPSPWTDQDTARGGSDPGVVYKVSAVRRHCPSIQTMVILNPMPSMCYLRR